MLTMNGLSTRADYQFLPGGFPAGLTEGGLLESRRIPVAISGSAAASELGQDIPAVSAVAWSSTRQHVDAEHVSPGPKRSTATAIGAEPFGGVPSPARSGDHQHRPEEEVFP
jgi:hypothetical protein